MTQNDKDVKTCAECSGECGLVCECTECECGKKLTPETAALVDTYSLREKGC